LVILFDAGVTDTSQSLFSLDAGAVVVAVALNAARPTGEAIGHPADIALTGQALLALDADAMTVAINGSAGFGAALQPGRDVAWVTHTNRLVPLL
jgi:hypothetical protein